MNDELKKIANTDPCTEGMEEKVLALAEGNAVSDKELEEVFTHFLSCDSCRHLFEEYYFCEEAQAETQPAAVNATLPSLSEIIIKFINGMISPLGDTFLNRAPAASVLSGEPAMVIDYTLPSERGKLPLRIIGTGNDIRIEIKSDNDKSVFYLFHRGEYERSNTYEGVAVFENVEPDDFILARDMQDFVKIKIINK